MRERERLYDWRAKLLIYIYILYTITNSYTYACIQLYTCISYSYTLTCLPNNMETLACFNTCIQGSWHPGMQEVSKWCAEAQSYVDDVSLTGWNDYLIRMLMVILMVTLLLMMVNCWLVVSNISYFHPYLGKISILTNIFSTVLKPPTRLWCWWYWRWYYFSICWCRCWWWWWQQ